MTMSRLFVGALAVFGVLCGWAVGRAQSSAPDFVLTVSTSVVDGAVDTTVNCQRGCRLSWVERGVNPRASAMERFHFNCKGSSQCSSGAVGGWIEK
jgi:hypothetical protein